jgi:hypothetical protein
MSGSPRHLESGDALENFAAELTTAAYSIALRHGITGSWIEVELPLWRTLSHALKKWAQERLSAGSPDDLNVWTSMLVDVTQNSLYVALKHGIKGSLLEVELGLYRVFRLLIARHCEAPHRGARPGCSSGSSAAMLGRGWWRQCK